MGFVWGLCDCEVGVVRKTHQGGEEGSGRVACVVQLNGEGQGKCQEEVQEGPFCPSLRDCAA